jgi:hypothetical protein
VSFHIWYTGLFELSSEILFKFRHDEF